MQLTSEVFQHEGTIPAKYSCDGQNINPPLRIQGVPEKARSLVLIMDDPDVPAEIRPDQMFDHWIVWNIRPETTFIDEGQEPRGVIGNNTAGSQGYTGPCPPDREHRYFFKLYALDKELDLAQDANKQQIEDAMDGHILAQAVLMGRYDRQK